MNPGFPERSGDVRVRWKKRFYRLRRVYEEDPVAARELAPDRRPFLFETADGSVREVRGYRGDGGPLGRRGLPVCDARLLVNLAAPLTEGAVFLDPFAGAGGLVLEARERGWRTVGIDLDPRVRHGLSRIADLHLVSDARLLPFRDASIDAVASEPPYDPGSSDSVGQAFREMARTLRPGGRAALLVSVPQADRLRAMGAASGLVILLDSPIDRKGLDVVALAWERPSIP